MFKHDAVLLLFYVSEEVSLDMLMKADRARQVVPGQPFF